MPLAEVPNPQPSTPEPQTLPSVEVLNPQLKPSNAQTANAGGRGATKDLEERSPACSCGVSTRGVWVVVTHHGPQLGRQVAASYSVKL